MTKELKDFKKFCSTNIALILYTFFLTIAIYGIKIVNYSYGMDTNAYISNQKNYFWHWLSIGRFGEVFIKKYLWGSFTNIYLLNILTFILFACSSILLCYFFDKLLIRKTKKIYIIPSIFITSQVFVYQFYFVLQNFEFAIGMILVLLAAILLESSSENKQIRVLKFVLSIALLVFSISIYQSFALYFVGIAVAILSIKVYNNYATNSVVRFFDLVKVAIPYVATAITSLILYILVDKLVGKLLNVPRLGHESAMMLWFKVPFKEAFISLLKSLKRVILMPNFGNQANVYTFGLLFGIVLMIIILIRLAITKNKNLIAVTICFFTLLFSGLGMIFATATTPLPRSMVPQFPFMVAFLLFYASLFFNKKVLNYTIVIMVAVFSFNQVKTSSNLVVSEQMTFEEDQRTIMRIVSAVDDLHLENPSSYHLIILGSSSSKNAFNLSVQNELVGLSMFKFGLSGDGSAYHITNGILEIMRIMGINFKSSTREQYDEYWKNKTTFTEDTEFGVEVIDDFIIVKIS
ncbi:glucosyltransferase domain-containing protein [Enterococcus sp. LJL99]